MTQAMRLPRSRRTRLVAASSAAVIVWSLAAAAQAQDLPTNPVIVNSNGVGTAADFTFGANLLTIDQHHDRVVIDWDDFNIGALDTVTFNQPDAGAIAFNRVDPSAFTTIDGTLNANGGVWLFSPGGLLFGSGAVVNVGSFVGTTARLDDADIADALGTNTVTFSPLALANGADLTVSAGADITATSGFVVLLGETIVQNGAIVSDNDAVWFGVAQGGEITFTSDGPGSPPELADGTVAAVAGQQPAFTQSNTGATTAATWVGVSSPSTVANGWSTLINLGGTIEASGIKPSTDAGVFIITGDDGVYDLTAVGTTVDSTGGLITANNGDVYIRTGQAILQDVYAEDIDAFTGGDLTLTGAIQATGDIVIGSDTLISIESTAVVDADIDVTVTTTAAGGDIYVDGDVYGYSSVVMVAHDQLTVDGTIEGVYGVYLFSTDTTAAAGSLITSNQDVYIQADGDAIFDGAVYGGAIDIQSDNLASVSGILDAGYVNIETSAGDILIENGAQVSGTAGGFAVSMYAHTDLTIEDGATVYSVQNMRLETITGELSIGGYLDGIFVDLYGAAGATVTETGYVQGNSIHLRSGGDVFMDGDLYTNNFIGIYSDADITIGQYGSVEAFSINVVADGGLITEAGSLIDNSAGVGTISLRAYGPDGAGSAMELSGDIDAHNLQLVTGAGSVAVLDGTITAGNDVNGYIAADFITAAPSLIDATGDISLDVTGNIDLAGDISAYSFEAYADGDFTQSGGTITVENGGFFASALGDISTDAGASITNAVSSDNVVIELFAGNSVYLDGDIHGYEVFVDSTGPMIMIGGSIYATDFIFIYNDTGSLHLTGTADLEAGTPVVSSFSSIYMGAYGSVRVDAGAQITAGVGQPGAYVSLYANGPTGYLNMSGDITSGGIYMGARSGDVDVYIGGSLDADEDIFIGATGDLVTGAGSGMIAGDYVWISGDASVDLSGDIYAYQVAIYSDGDVTQSAGTITVEDGGLYVYAFNDIITEAGALIEAAPGAANAIIYLNAAYDLYLAGDIDGTFFVTINSVGTNYDTVLEVSGSIYATDWIILYNDYGDIHLTGTADLYVGSPTVFSEPGIFIAAEGSILTDAGSHLHTRPGYADGYVHFEVNDVTGSIDLSGDITSENLTIEAPFGVVDIYLRGGVIDTVYDLTIDSNGQLLLDATIYADNFYLSADDQLSVGGVLNATGDVTLNSDTGVAVTAGGQIFGYDISIGTPGVTDIDGAIYGQTITVGGYDGIYVSGTLDASGEVNIISLYGDVAIENGAYIRGYSFGTAVYVQADGDLLVENGADIISYGDLMLVGGTVDFDGYAYAANFNVQSAGDLDIGVNGEVLTPGVIHLLSEDGPPVAADITIAGSLTGEDGIYIANRNDGDVVVTADAEVIAAYFMGLRLGPRGQTSLGGMDGDIYIYSAGSVVTDYGSLIDATGGVGSDQGLLTIVAAGTDGPSATPAAIDLSGDIVAWNVDMTATAGSIRQRTGQITVADYFTADAELNFIQDGGGVIEGLSGLDRAYIDIDANNNILLLGLISGYYVDLTTTGTVPGSEIQLAGEVYASDGITITNLDGDILVHSTGVIHTGDPFDAPSPDILMVANGVITTQAGSQIYTDPNYSAYSTITLQSTLASGQGIDLAGDIATAGYVDIVTTVNADIQITGGTIQAGQDVDVRSQNQIDITGGLIEAGDTVFIRADADILLGGDIYADYIDAATYGGESGGVYGSVIRVEGQLTALTDIDITNQVGGVEIGAGAVLNGNYSGQPDIGAPAVDIFGYSILTEAGSLITVGPAGGPTVGDIVITAYADFAGPGPAIDLSGDIEADALYFNVGAYNDMRVRDGDISTLGALDIVTDGYFIVDDPANFFVGGDFSALSYGGMDIDGDIFADRIALTDDSGSGLAVGGGLLAGEDIRLEALQGDVHIGGYAFIRADTDGVTSIGEYNGIDISAYDQVIADPGSRLYSGPIGAPTGDVSITAQGLDSGGFAAIDLGASIEAQNLYIDAVAGSVRLRSGDIVTVGGIDIDVYGYFDVDDPASIETGGHFYASADDGVTFDGYLQAQQAVTLRSDYAGVSIGGQINGYETILVDSAGDIAIGPDAILWSDYDLSGPNTGITLDADGQVVTAASSEIHVGQDGNPTGDVAISADGIDSGGYAAIDLAGDIDAADLILSAPNGSIRLRDGDIVLTDDFSVSGSTGFVMDGLATLTTDGYVDVAVTGPLTVAGTIASGDDIILASTGLPGGPVTINGYLYADGGVIIASYDPDSSIVLGGPTIIADADNSGGDGSILVTSAGGVLAPGGGLIQVGDGSGAPTGDVAIVAGGADGPNAALDLSIDINAQTLTLDAPYGSIHLAGGDIYVTNDLAVVSAFDFIMDSPASIDSGGDVVISAADNLVMDGLITADGDVGLYAGGAGFGNFTPDPGDMVVGGSVSANGSVIIGNAGGDIYLDGTAQVLANADDLGATDEVYIYTDSQIVTAAGSSITVGTGLVASGDVTLLADGADNANYSAIDLSGNIYAANLSLQTTNGSIAVNDGAINGDLGITIDSAADFTLEDGVYAITGGSFIADATGDMTLDGVVSAADSILVTRSGAGVADIVVSGELYAAGDIGLVNNGAGDIVLNGAVVLADYDGTGPGSVQILSNGGVYAYNGGLIASGNVNDPTNLVSITAYGVDNGALAAIDLDVDIAAGTLQLNAPNGSIHIEGGSIVVLNPLTIDSGLDVLVADAAYIDAGADVSIYAGRDLTMDGEIDSAGSVRLEVSGPSGDQISVGGLIYADEGVFVLNYGGDIYVSGARLIADADGVGGDGYLTMVAAGDLIVNGADLGVGYDGESATGGMALSSSGDTVIDANTWSTSLDIFGYDSVHLVGGQFEALGDVEIGSVGTITTDAGADIFAGGDVSVLASTGIALSGDIAAGGDIDVGIYIFGALETAFVAGPFDVVVAGDLSANGSVNVSAAYYGGDVYLAGTASLQADADNSASGDQVYLLADGQVVSAAGSTIAVGPSGSPTGDVRVEAFGADNASYSAIDLNSDIEAVNLSLDADAGSVNIAGGAIEVSGDVYVEADYDIIQDQAASIDAGGDVYFGANRALTVAGSIHADGDVELLIDAPYSGLLTIDTVVAAGGDIDVVNQGGDVLLGSQAALFSGQDILLQAYGDLTTDGFIDSAATFTADAGGALVFQSDLQAGAGANFVSDGAMTLDAVIIAEQYSGITAQSGTTLSQSGQLIAGGAVQLTSEGDMTIAGSVTALGDVILDLYGGESGGDIVVSGDIVSHDDIRIDNTADYGDVLLTGTGSLTADVDGNGDYDTGVTIYAEGRIIAEAGSTMHVGSPTQRTGLILLGSYAYDGEGGAAIELAGDIDAESVEIWADYGSVHVQGGAIQADESVEIYAYEDFIHDDGALIWGAQDRAFQDDVSTETTLPGLLLPGVLITASDVDISGDIQSGSATDDATIVIAALNVDGDVTVGGADNGLGTGFTLSDAEFQNLIADRIVLLAGTGPDAPDLIVSDLSIDAANTADVWLGTTGSVFVEGAVAPTQPGEVDLHIGFTVLTQGNNLLTALDPGQILVDFIPTDIHISGSLGDVTNPFGHVTLVANGDILMGSSAFMAAAENDPEFDAFEESENFDSPGEGHVFIAADLLQMAATGEILQQDTVEGPGFGGLVLGQPQAGYELIFSPDDIEGQPIGFGTEQWTANFNAGPTRIELFGQFNGTPHAVTGTEAARLDHLLDPDILLGDYEFNTCLFGGTQCQTGNDTPPFQNPTPPVHPDPSVIPGVDEVASFFTTFPFAEPDEEEEEERIEGEPVTGSGNEDLWPVTTQGGTRP